MAQGLEFDVKQAVLLSGSFGPVEIEQITEAIAGEGRILTAGGIDSHIHFICPQQIEDALHSGLTTMLGRPIDRKGWGVDVRVQVGRSQLVDQNARPLHASQHRRHRKLSYPPGNPRPYDHHY